MLAGVFIVFVTLVWFIRTWYNRHRYPPGPFPLPFIGNLHLLRKDIHLQMDRLAQHYGSVFTLWMAQIPFIVVTDIEVARKVTLNRRYADRLPLYVGHELYSRGSKDMIFGDYGPSLVMHKKLIISSLQMFGDGLVGLEGRILTSVGCLMKTCRDMCGDETYDMRLDVEVTTFNVIASIVFGNTITKTDKSFIKLREAILLMMQSGVTLSLINFYPVLRYLPNRELAEMQHVLRERDQVLRETYTAAEKNFRPGHVTNYIEALLQTRYEMATSEKGSGGDSLSIDHIEMNIFDMFLGGVDTVATTLRWTIMYLIKWPHVQRKLQEELDSVMGAPQVLGETPGYVTLERKRDMPYVMATIYETLRLASTLPFGVFHKSREDTVLAGYKLKTGTATMINLWTIHHDANNFKDPFEFQPERFLDTAGNLMPLHKTRHFFAFSAGPRQCPGQDLAKTELFLFTSNLFYNFSFSSSSLNTSLELHGTTKVTHAPNPYKVVVRSRATAPLATSVPTSTSVSSSS